MSGLSGETEMPSIKHNGFSLRIRTNDHPPPHIHVVKAGGELVFILGNKGREPFLDRVLSPMKKTDARNALEAVKANKKEMWKKWRATHERDKF